jgi:hypothetical protein
MICSHLFEEVDHPQCVIAPIGRLGHWQVVNAAHLVEVDKGVCVPDDCQAGLNIKSRLETDPGIDAPLVETLEGLDPVPRQGRRTLPLQGEVVVQAGESRREGVAIRAEQADVPQRPRPSLGKRADAETVLSSVWQVRVVLPG